MLNIQTLPTLFPEFNTSVSYATPLRLQNKNITLFQSLLFLFILSFIVSYISKFVENKNPFYKKFCEKNILCPTYSILFIRFLHYFSTFFLCFYYFIFNTKYDLYYLILYTLLVLHWVVTNDCLLSNLEMSYYSENKTLGDNPLLHPHYRVFAGDYTDYIILIQAILMTMSFLLVIQRFHYKYYNYLFCATVLFLQSYLMLKDRVTLT